MEKFATLEPVRLHPSGRFFSKPTSKPKPSLIGPLPSSLHQLILSYLPIPDIPAYALVCRATHSLVKDETLWELRFNALCIEKHDLGSVLDDLETVKMEKTSVVRAKAPPTLAVSNNENELDEFGDFAAVDDIVSAPMEEMDDFVGSFGTAAPSNNSFNLFAPSAQPQASLLPEPTHPSKSKRSLYIRAHILLQPLVVVLAPTTPPHLVLTSLSSFLTSPLAQSPSTTNPRSLASQSKVFQLLAHFLSAPIQPVRSWRTLASALRGALDRFDASLLAAFDIADGKNDEKRMREAAEASWRVWLAGRVGLDVGGGTEDWEMGKVWADKREIFYEQGRWDPLANFISEARLDFDAMDEFMSFVINAILEHGSRAVRVFPPESGVLIAFAERIAGEVVGEYVTTLLTRARELSSSSTSRGTSALFLQATAASFKEAWRMVDAIMQAAKERDNTSVGRTRAEDVVYQMFETNMDEYLDEEAESLKQVFDVICTGWDREYLQKAIHPHEQQQQQQPRFLTAQNPAQVKRNVLASFTSILLLPVTIVPRTVGAVGTGIGEMLGMGGGQRWRGGSVNITPYGNVSTTGWGTGAATSGKGGKEPREKELGNNLDNGDVTVFEVGEEEEDEDDDDDENERRNAHEDPVVHDPWAQSEKGKSNGASTGTATPDAATTNAPGTPSVNTATNSNSNSTSNFNSNSTSNFNSNSNSTGAANSLELLLSLDVALEVIHADREALKRVETFADYPGHYGHRVRDTIEEIFILMLTALREGHISKGFAQATEQMTAYQPAEHEESTSVAPLLQFFELVHIGDTMQSMVQVYFDRELAHHIDRTDFLNAVVREKKRFENALDDSVAAGLNAGTEVLMKEVEHIILTRTQPREYYPPEDAPLDLGPTKGCIDSIRSLEIHCKLLKGSTSREVLEVFYQEVGIRLIAILQKHIKRQIISLNGGFQVIADLNTYHAFISSLKVPSIASDFSNLKMLGHVFVVEDAKDLAQIVRDVTRYGGAYRPEDIYEFIQRRSDWKKIEKTVDKTMYSLSFKEDCVVC